MLQDEIGVVLEVRDGENALQEAEPEICMKVRYGGPEITICINTISSAEKKKNFLHRFRKSSFLNKGGGEL